MYTIEERTAVISYRLTFEEGWESFTRIFHKLAPTRHAIKKMVNKFKRTGSVTEEHRTGRPAVANETVQRIQEAITRSPSASTRRLSRELGIAHTTVWKTNMPTTFKLFINLKMKTMPPDKLCFMTYWMLLEMKI